MIFLEIALLSMSSLSKGSLELGYIWDRISAETFSDALDVVFQDKPKESP